VVLEEYGLTIDETGNGRIGVEMATATNYDLILMDVQMPEMDGLTATKLMRDHGLQTPIIALSANVMKGFEQELFDAGYTDYLTKPIDLDRFMPKLAELLNAELKQEPFTESIMSESFIEEASNAEDTSPIVSRLGRNNHKFAKVIARFVGRLEEQLPAMDEAFWAQDFEALAKLAHWLKGAGGTVGFDVFYEPASELESAAKAMDLPAIERQLQQIHGLAGRLVIDDQPAIAGPAPQSD
jgi:CheY-like chemotaxis protein